MSSILDLNSMVTSIYGTIMSLQKSITETMGIDVYWCRALPYQNSEDIIVQEYTLSNVECPRQIKVVTDNTGYQSGNFQVDLWGVAFDSPLEVSVDIETWNSVYGKDSMPQKGDIVVMPMLHRIFQVTSSTVVNSMQALPTSYKIQLGKYSRQASRRESDEVRISIDELTRNQQDMFGDDISREVADAVVEVETSYNETTYVDPFKRCDLDSIDAVDIVSSAGNLFAESCYDFSRATQDVVYDISAEYDPGASANRLVFSCWFNLDGGVQDEGMALRITGLHHKDRSAWYFSIDTALRLEAGEDVTISRGKLLRVKGEIDDAGCGGCLVLKVPADEVMSAHRKLASWWTKAGAWRISRPTVYNLFSAYDGDRCVVDYSVADGVLEARFGDHEARVELKGLELGWNYAAIEVSPTATRCVVSQERRPNDTGDRSTVLLAEAVDGDAPNTRLRFDTCSVENSGKGIRMANIRLYENEYDMGDTWLIDRYSEVTRNASKLILVDVPRPANKMSFISPIK